MAFTTARTSMQRAEALRARHEEQIAAVQPRRRPDHLSRKQVAWQRKGVQLASGACWGVFDLAPRLLARRRAQSSLLIQLSKIKIVQGSHPVSTQTFSNASGEG